MISIFLKTPLLGILTAILAVVLEQLLAVAAGAFWQKEIVFSFYSQLNYFIVAAVIIEEGLKYLAIRYPLRKIFAIRGLRLAIGSFLTGFFFGITEIWLIVMSDKNYLVSLRSHDTETLFSFSAIVLLQALTAFLTGSLIAIRSSDSRGSALKILFFPVLVHVLFNFLVIQKGYFTKWLEIITLALTFLLGSLILIFNFRKLD